MALEDLSGNLRLDYRCDFQRYDYEGAPVDVYLAAVAGPIFSGEEPFGLNELFAGGEVRIFRPDMETYESNGVVEGPTLRGVSFPPAPAEGSLMINTVSASIYRQPIAFAAVFVRSGTGEFVATGGLPAVGSNIITPN